MSGPDYAQTNAKIEKLQCRECGNHAIVIFLEGHWLGCCPHCGSENIVHLVVK